MHFHFSKLFLSRFQKITVPTVPLYQLLKFQRKTRASKFFQRVPLYRIWFTIVYESLWESQVQSLLYHPYFLTICKNREFVDIMWYSKSKHCTSPWKYSIHVSHNPVPRLEISTITAVNHTPKFLTKRWKINIRLLSKHCTSRWNFNHNCGKPDPQFLGFRFGSLPHSPKYFRFRPDFGTVCPRLALNGTVFHASVILEIYF